MQKNEYNLIGQGIYSIPEAAHLIGLPNSRVRRWVQGYHGSTGKSYATVVPSELPEIDGKQVISFHDLLELHFIKAFIGQGVSLPAVRKAAELAAEILGVESHPFITHRFMTDKKSILHQVGERMLNLNFEQYELEGIIKQSLFSGLIFENNNAIASAWHPSNQEKSVILNPKYALGKPIIEHTGIRTRTIFYAWQAEGKDSKIVAGMFGLKTKEVMEAVRFEQRLAA